ncbi:hypothetical protein U9M48_034565 [Paspalum notatum var. saurae]|uniref:Disease resistance R13L4/SHOC-2-like LRR domain-containing protein n=1 Tax=Paspalum notatum var. saurae TaxID=547442 RepID=A0AAQ3X6V8_PASNO
MNPSLLLDLFFLEIGVRELQQQDLEMLGKLPALCYLDLKVNHENNVRRFTIGAFSFPCLVVCVLRGFGGPVVFQQGAMPRLAHLSVLGFPVHEIREIDGGFDLGLSYLPSLQKFTVHVRSGDASKEEVEEAKAVIKHAIQLHPNHPTLHMEDYE